MRIIFTVILFSLVQQSVAETIAVCKDCEFKTLQAATTASKPGDHIKVYPGTYFEHDILIDKKIRITGIDYPVVDGEKQGHILKIIADSVSISGFKIINVGHSYTKEFAAVHIFKADNFNIKDLILENVFFGILVEKSHNGYISNNTISGEAEEEAAAGNGIHLWHCSNVDIEKNEIFKLRDGIYFEFVSESTISDNLSHDNIRYGLHFMFSNHDEYKNNVFTRNGAGVAVMFSKFIYMYNNVFIKNWGTASYGLLLKEIYDAEIVDNLFEENTIGIKLEGSTRINYLRNNFVRNGWAVKIAGACYTNNFKNNNFLHNSFDISYNSKLNDNSFESNYWSSYTGYDLDQDGIGDVPYRPVKLFSYVVNRTPETIVLLRSLFVDLINFSEKVSPVFTPDNLMDSTPLMSKIR